MTASQTEATPGIPRRLFVEWAMVALSGGSMAACGGGGGGGSEAPPPAPVPAPVPPAPPAPAAGDVIANLRLQATSTGEFPYSATVLPRIGQMPTGFTLVSPDDGRLRAAVLSRHADNSAAVVVVSSYANVTAGGDTQLRLQLATTSSEANLTAAAVTAAVSSLVIDCGALGRVSLTDFSSPELVWWQSPQTICARYRSAFGGHATLEAVVDIQAWSGGRALVEVVVENGKMNTTTPTSPSQASYTGATVTVNGALVATVNGNGAPEGAHARFRAWYAKAWAGTSEPGLRAVQHHAELQSHPLLWKMASASTADLSIYAADAYSPWATGRQRATNMGAAGDHPSIGPLPQWAARALQTGDARAWRAVEANDLCIVGYNINYRDSGTGLVPTFAQLAGKSMQSNWPSIYAGEGPMGWKDSHHPAVGLMSFISRPSPVFIELAQKVAVWNGTWSTYNDGGPTLATGVFVSAYQTRGKAWGMRSLGHATFLTPDGMAWKAAGQDSLAANFTYLDAWRTDAKQTNLAIMWETRTDVPIARNGNTSRVNFKLWQHHYLLWEVAKIANAQLLKPANQSAANTFVDWALLHPVRWITDQASTGAWRHVPEALVLGAANQVAPAMTNAQDYASQRATWTTEAPPAAVAGPWRAASLDSPTNYSTQWVDDNSAGVSRATYLWPALVAAVERGVPGAATAWATVQSQLTGLNSWLGGFGADPRWGATPRTT